MAASPCRTSRVAPARARRRDVLTIGVDVANAGRHAAEETVFLFTRDKVASVARPLLELKGFGKIALKPGESGRVTLSLPVSDLRFLGADLEPVLEPGDFEILVGPCADRARLLAGTVDVEASGAPHPVIPAERSESRDRPPKEAPHSARDPGSAGRRSRRPLSGMTETPPVALSGATLPEAGEGFRAALSDTPPGYRRAFRIPPRYRTAPSKSLPVFGEGGAERRVGVARPPHAAIPPRPPPVIPAERSESRDRPPKEAAHSARDPGSARRRSRRPLSGMRTPPVALSGATLPEAGEGFRAALSDTPRYRSALRIPLAIAPPPPNPSPSSGRVARSAGWGWRDLPTPPSRRAPPPSSRPSKARAGTALRKGPPTPPAIPDRRAPLAPPLVRDANPTRRPVGRHPPRSRGGISRRPLQIPPHDRAAPS